MKFTSFVLPALVAVFAAASPVARSASDVYSPPLLTPAAGTVWEVNTTQTVTWDVSNPPAEITNPVGLIFLLVNGENFGLILADGFNILDGKIDVTVPWMVDGTDYQLLLMGDSGNSGPVFSISGSGFSFQDTSGH